MKRKLDKSGNPTKPHGRRRPVAKLPTCGECGAWTLSYNGSTGRCADLGKLTLKSEVCRKLEGK